MKQAVLGAGIMLISVFPCAGDDIDPAVENAISAAEAAIAQAVSVGGEWLDTGRLLKKAKAAAQKGKTATALQLAARARILAELGYRQSMDQQHAGPNFERTSN